MYSYNINWIMNILPIDLIEYCIFDKLDFLTQIRFRQICKWLNRIKIHNMYYYMNIQYIDRLSNKILINYPEIKYLMVSYNSKVSNINHMTKLQILDASCVYLECGIGDNGIKNLNLIELYAADNKKIKNVNHMTNLKILNASWSCGINDVGIKDLNLIKLNAKYNPKITDVNHMTNLKILDASGENCGLNDNGIKNLNNTAIYSIYNKKITTK